MSGIVCLPYRFPAYFQKSRECQTQTILHIDYIQVYFIRKNNCYIIPTGLCQNLLKVTTNHSDLPQWNKRQNLCSNLVFLFYVNHYNSFALACFADRACKGRTAITVKFASYFHWFVNMSQGCIIKFLQDISGYLVNISDSTNLRIHSFYLFCIFARGKIELMADQNIPLSFINFLTIKQTMNGLII